jgi:hypothetical protein
MSARVLEDAMLVATELLHDAAAALVGGEARRGPATRCADGANLVVVLVLPLSIHALWLQRRGDSGVSTSPTLPR